MRQVFELATPIICQHLVALAIRFPVRRQTIGSFAIFVPANSTVGNGKIEPAIVIEIAHQGPKSRSATANRGQPPVRGEVAKFALRPLCPECIRFPRQMGHIEIEKTIIIDVSHRDSHSGKGMSHRTPANSPG